MHLLSHQYNFVNSLFEKLNSYRFIVIKGESGCGKSYSFQWASKNSNLFGFEEIMILDSDFLTEDQDYFPFKKALYIKESNPSYYVKQGAIEASKDTPFVGNLVSFMIASILKPNANLDIDLFSDEERVLINQIKKVTKKRKFVLFVTISIGGIVVH